MYTIKKPTFVYKKVLLKDEHPGVAKLLLMPGARINEVLSSRDKNRCDGAFVVSITALEGPFAGKQVKTALCRHSNQRRHKTVYRAGKMVRPHKFDTSDSQCAAGIHFFRHRSDAERYA